ncbi:MAG TPA: right-handed parallel beta-helix repeat-containing protein [Fimbriiglobus sp.]|jgi:hypothetical protein
MFLSTWLGRPTPARRSDQSRPFLERLDDRALPSTFWVSSTLDSGPGSLRQAVLGANAHPGSDEIRFKHSAEGTVILTAELGVTDDVAIDGPGAKNLTVSGGGATRVFNIAAGATVKIEDLTIANGKVADAANGGGILNAGILTLADSVVTGNVAPAGAGIENTGTLTVKLSKVTGNQATNNGGGIHNAGTGTAVIDRSAVSDNTCVGDGAGIRSEIGTALTITDSVVSGNSASGFGTGGIASGATLTIRDSLIAGNTSAAAGLYLFGFSRSGDVLISRSVIRDNGPNATSGSGVGGLWSASSKSIRIEDTVIRDNTGSRAGGVYGAGTIDVVGSVIEHNTGGSAGGLYAFDTLTLTRSTVRGNTGSTAGVHAQTATVVESTISGNTGTAIGGVYGYQLDLIDSTVSGNTASPTGSFGVGGVDVTNGSIRNSTISGNAVIGDKMQAYHGTYGDTGDAAGGVFAQAGYGGSAVEIQNSTIAFNRVTGAPADIPASGGVAVSRPFSFVGYYGYSYDFSTVLGVRNTIIARNQSNVGGPDVGGEFQSGGHNLIGVLTPDATGFVASDMRGTQSHPLDPRLKPLAYNGGPTQTHALAPNSPALNAGDNADVPTTDQRGYDRIVGGVIDIGAYEAGGHGSNDHHDHGGWCSLFDPPENGHSFTVWFGDPFHFRFFGPSGHRHGNSGDAIFVGHPT